MPPERSAIALFRPLVLVFLVAAGLTAPRTAHAVQLQVDLLAVVTDYSGAPPPIPDLNAFIAAGTPVTGSLRFDVSGSAPAPVQITLVEGSFAWNDGLDRVFELSAFDSTNGSFLIFDGAGPTIADASASQFAPAFVLAEDPDTSTSPWATLLLGASIPVVGAQIDSPSISAFALSFLQVSSYSISVIPEPSTALLLWTGLCGTTWARRRSRSGS
jgi:hypothetical protein